MNSENNKSQPPKSIQDIKPPNDSLGNPEEFANIPVKAAPDAQPAQENPIMAAGHNKAAQDQPADKDENLDKVLKDVNKEVKAASNKPKKPQKPTLIITATVIVTIILIVAAFSAFKKS